MCRKWEDKLEDVENDIMEKVENHITDYKAEVSPVEDSEDEAEEVEMGETKRKFTREDIQSAVAEVPVLSDDIASLKYEMHIFKDLIDEGLIPEAEGLANNVKQLTDEQAAVSDFVLFFLDTTNYYLISWRKA